MNNVGTSTRPARKARVFGSDVVQRIVERGDSMLYARRGFLPVLEVHVIAREVAREQLGVLELTVLKLVGDGVSTVAWLSRLLGISDGRLGSFLREFVQRGLLDVAASGHFSLSDTGLLCAQHGREVIDVKRAVLLSGLTGELLPTSAYQLERLAPASLQALAKSTHLLVESSAIPLAGLDLRRISDKRAVNLPEETQAILGLTGEQHASFIECFLAVFAHASDLTQLGVEVCLPNAVLDDVAVELVLPYLEPYGFSNARRGAGALEELAADLARAGSTVAGAQLDLLGNPALELTCAAPSLLTQGVQGRCLAYYVGTAAQRALPISELYLSGSERLHGHTLTLTLETSEQAAELERIRQLHDALDASFRDRAGAIDILHAISKVCAPEEAVELANAYKDRRLIGTIERAQIG